MAKAPKEPKKKGGKKPNPFAKGEMVKANLNPKKAKKPKKK